MWHWYPQECPAAVRADTEAVLFTQKVGEGFFSPVQSTLKFLYCLSLFLLLFSPSVELFTSTMSGSPVRGCK